MAGTLVAAFALVLAGALPAAAADSDDILSGLNSARASAGKPALARNASLDSVALGWANQMAAANAMSHNPNAGAQIPAGWTSWGENVANGFPTGSATNAGWTASPGHYANMLGDFTDVGIAFVPAGGTTWAVEVFARYPATAVSSQTAPVAAQTAPQPAAPQPAAPAPAAPQPAAPAPAAPAAPAEPAQAAPASPGETAQPSAADAQSSKTTVDDGASVSSAPRPSSSRQTPTAGAADDSLWAGLAAVPLALGVYLVLRRRRRPVPTARG